MQKATKIVIFSTITWQEQLLLLNKIVLKKWAVLSSGKESRDIIANLEKIGRRIHVDTVNMTVSNLKQYLD